MNQIICVWLGSKTESNAQTERFVQIETIRKKIHIPDRIIF